MLRTAGSTSSPRLVVRTTASWVGSFAHVSRLAGIDAGSRVWVPGPMSSSMNLFAVVHAAHAGATLVDGPEPATHAVLTPSGFDAALGCGEAQGLTVVVAGDRLSPALHARARDLGVAVHHYYGSAETSFIAWGSHADDLRPFPGVEIDVRENEIWVRSPYLCRGYDGPSDATGPLRRDTAGFVTVGDRGRLEDDRLLVDGRPDAVTTGGATVLTADVERVLRRAATGVVAVVGVPHAQLGAVVAAILTDAADHTPLQQAARAELSAAARPRLWLECPELPTTPAGKLDREALAELAADDGRLRRLV